MAHGYMKTSAHLVSFLHRQIPVPCTLYPGREPAGAVVLRSSSLALLPWDALRNKFQIAMQTLDLQTTADRGPDGIYYPISPFEEAISPIDEWCKKKVGIHGRPSRVLLSLVLRLIGPGLDITGVQFPNPILFGVTVGVFAEGLCLQG